MENNVTKKYVWGIPADTYCPCPSPAQMEAVLVEEKRENKKHRFSLLFFFHYWEQRIYTSSRKREEEIFYLVRKAKDLNFVIHKIYCYIQLLTSFMSILKVFN